MPAGCARKNGTSSAAVPCLPRANSTQGPSQGGSSGGHRTPPAFLISEAWTSTTNFPRLKLSSLFFPSQKLQFSSFPSVLPWTLQKANVVFSSDASFFSLYPRARQSHSRRYIVNPQRCFHSGPKCSYHHLPVRKERLKLGCSPQTT